MNKAIVTPHHHLLKVRVKVRVNPGHHHPLHQDQVVQHHQEVLHQILKVKKVHLINKSHNSI